MTKTISWDERRDIAIPGDSDETIEYCVRHFIKSSKEAITHHAHFAVALSGGSTPKKIFEKLCSPAYRDQIEWKKLFLFWSDERSVPPDHPDSNYHMAMQAGFAEMPIPPSQIHRMHADEDIIRNARVYQDKIHILLGKDPFDLIMLGMGEDGHTASLFPDTQALQVTDKLVVANQIPQKATWRMTMTFPCINHAKHIVFYVMGAQKKEMIHEVFTSSHSYPCQRVGTPTHKALWILDKDAASNLPLKN